MRNELVGFLNGERAIGSGPQKVIKKDWEDFYNLICIFDSDRPSKLNFGTIVDVKNLGLEIVFQIFSPLR